jgi:hypothetical protein
LVIVELTSSSLFLGSISGTELQFYNTLVTYANSSGSVGCNTLVYVVHNLQ